MFKRPLHSQERLSDVNRIFYDDYRICTPENVKEVHLAYGEIVHLLKKVKTSHKNINVSGVDTTQGRLGGRRVSYPTGGPQIATDYGRPEEAVAEELKQYPVPALLELSGQVRTTEGGGITIATSSTIRFSSKILDEKELTINAVEDLLLYDGIKYKFIKKYKDIFYLGMVAEYAFEIEETH